MIKGKVRKKKEKSRKRIKSEIKGREVKKKEEKVKMRKSENRM